MRFAHVHDFRGGVAQDAQGYNPVEDFVVSRLLQLLRGKLRQFVALARAQPLKVPAVGLDVNGAASELVGQEAVRPTG